MLSKQRALSGIWALEKDGRFHDVLVRHPDSIAIPDLEGKATAADALGLVLDLLEAATSDRDAHLDQPVIEVSAELNIAGLGPQGFGLKPKQNEAGARAVGNAHRFRLSVGTAPHTGFNDETHALTVNLPA